MSHDKGRGGGKVIDREMRVTILSQKCVRDHEATKQPKEEKRKGTGNEPRRPQAAWRSKGGSADSCMH